MKERLLLVVKIAGMTVLMAWLFYDSPLGLLCGLVVVPLLVNDYRQNQQQRERYEMEQQFCAGLNFAAGALEAGYSAENAWRQTQQEIEGLYGAEAVFARKLQEMNQGVSVNQPLERLVWEFGQTSDSDNIKNFSEVFFFARRSGGNLTAIMRRTAERIKQNFQIQEEVQLAISSRRLELLIMNVMPFAILGYLRFFSAEFMNPLYHCPLGVLVMTGCLFLYLLSWILAKKIIRIGV